MSKIISIHDYILKPGANERRFVNAILSAKKRGLLRLPGCDYPVLKTAIWLKELPACSPP